MGRSSSFVTSMYAINAGHKVYYWKIRIPGVGNKSIPQAQFTYDDARKLRDELFAKHNLPPVKEL